MLPLTLSGNNLGERHHQINNSVLDAVKQDIDFEQIRNWKEISEVDILFKIDFASKIKNVKFIMEILKCGVNLYISRALKSDWLFTDKDYREFILPEYVHTYLYPEMSEAMYKKFLTRISIYSDERLAESYFKYCYYHGRRNLQNKFFIYTSKEYKSKVIKSHNFNLETYMNVRNIFKDDIDLVDLYFENKAFVNLKTFINAFSYLYNVNNLSFLSLIEKHIGESEKPFMNDWSNLRLTKNITKSIIKNNMDEIISKPKLYTNIINLDILYVCANVNDLLKLLNSTLPKTLNDFWNKDFIKAVKYISKRISSDERFKTIHDLYTNAYCEEFETNNNFFSYGLHEVLMTEQERSLWAMDNLNNEREYFGKDNQFKWYQYCYDWRTSFNAIKKLVNITTDPYKRISMLKVLIVHCKTNEIVREYFEYIYKRHINEKTESKYEIVVSVFKNMRPYKMNIETWNITDKILNNLSVYENPKVPAEIVFETLLYYMFNNKIVPETLYHSLENIQLSSIKDNDGVLSKFHEQFLDIFITRLDNLEKKSYWQKQLVLKNIVYLLKITNTNPEIYPQLYNQLKQNNLLGDDRRTRDQKIMKLLKQNALLVTPDRITNKDSEKISKFFKKIRIYFNHDLTPVWITYCLENIKKIQKIHDENMIHSIYGITVLMSQDDYLKFVSDYLPSQGKIDWATIDKKLQYIQQVVAKSMSKKQPPPPVEIVMAFGKGDYLQYSRNTIKSLVTRNAKHNDGIKIVNELLTDKSVSSQKLGFQLASTTLKTNEVIEILSNCWKKTNNISLRKIFVNYILDYIKKASELSIIADYYKILKAFIQDLNINDDKELFHTLVSYSIDAHFLSDYIMTLWTVINNCTTGSYKVEMQDLLIRKMSFNIDCLDTDFVYNILMDNFSKIKESIYNNLFVEYVMKQKISNNDKPMLVLKEVLDKHFLDKWELVNIITSHCEIPKEFESLIHKLVQKAVDNLNCQYISSEPIFQYIYGEIERISQGSYKNFDSVLTVKLALCLQTILSKHKGNYNSTQQSLMLRELIMAFGKESTHVLDNIFGNNIVFLTKAVNVIDIFLKALNFRMNQSDVIVFYALGLICDGPSELALLIAIELHVRCKDGDKSIYNTFIKVIECDHVTKSDVVKKMFEINFYKYRK